MRAFLALSIFLLGCGGKNSADKTMTAEAAVVYVDPLTEVTITEDCKDGGTYQLTASLDVIEDPPRLTLSADYVYTSCVEKDNTITGTISYNKTQEELAPDIISTAIDYSGDLAYAGDHEGTCTASLAYTDESEKADKVSVTKSCPHPFGKILQKLESKCELKGGKGKKKPKKKDCKIL